MPAPVLVSDVITAAVSLLNDNNKTLFTDAVMLAHIKQAWADLQLALTENNAQELLEYHTDTTITAGVKEFPSLPTNLLYPVTLWERATTETREEDFIEMVERDDNLDPIESLEVWDWREHAVKFRGATLDRTVRMLYVKGIGALSTTGTTVPIPSAESYLAYRSAELAARFSGENPTRADQLAPYANAAMGKTVNLSVKKRQAEPVRRRSRYSL